MAGINYSIASADDSGKGKNVIGITEIWAEEQNNPTQQTASRTVKITVRGYRKDSNYALNSSYATGSSSLRNFSNNLGSIDGNEKTFCTFNIVGNTNINGTIQLNSSYYVEIGGYSTSSGHRAIKITFTDIYGLTIYNPTYYIYYKDADGNSWASDNTTSGKSLTIRTSGPSKSRTTSTSNFTITGNANGGYFNGNTSTTTTSITATKKIVTTYTFKNWNTNSSGTGTTYTPGQSRIMNSDLTLYPQYTSTDGSPTYSNNTISSLTKPTKANTTLGTYTVTYNLMGGSGSTTSDSATATRTWTFGGWATSSSASSANAAASYTSATTVYAYWTYTNNYGKVTLPSPTRTGYKLLGWSTSSAATTATYSPGASYEVKSNVTLYAVWEANGAVRVYIPSSSSFRMALAYIYNNSSWRLTIPEVYNNSTWRISGG